MSSSCEDKPAAAGGCCGAEVKFDGASPAYRRILLAVIGLNLLGFGVVAIGGLLQGSTALSANALDFIADAVTYAISLWAIGRSVHTRSGAALLKGGSLAVMAVLILGYALWRTLTGAPPSGPVISGLGLFGAAVNLAAAGLLVRYRNGDANVRSVWLCTRNDLAECLAVAGAGGLVWLTGSRWPDLLAGIVLAAIFLQSAWSIVAQARRELRSHVDTVGPAEFVRHSRTVNRSL